MDFVRSADPAKKWGKKCSTGQRFIFTEVTSYKIHTLVVFCFVDWLYYPFTIENCYFKAAKLVHGIKVVQWVEILSEVATLF